MKTIEVRQPSDPKEIPLGEVINRLDCLQPDVKGVQASLEWLIKERYALNSKDMELVETILTQFELENSAFLHQQANLYRLFNECKALLGAQRIKFN